MALTAAITTDAKDQQWLEILGEFQAEFGTDVYNSWLSKLHLVSLGDFEINMSVPTAFIRDWIKKEYMENVVRTINGNRTIVKKGIKQIILDKYPKIMSFDITVDTSLVNTAVVDDPTNNVVSFSKEKNIFSIGTELNKNFTFDNFVVGASNELAYSVAKSIVDTEEISTDTNPFFIYGGVGLGKTHLCQAIAWGLRQKYPEKQIIYLSAEKFMYLFVQSLQNQTIADFKNRFRNVDTLIIDDIHFIAGKDTTQKEFFHTFNTLIGENKQIILACDRAPADLENLDVKLKSRMAGGLIVDVHDTDHKLRFDFITLKSSQLSLDLSEDIINFMATNLKTNIREIDGALKRLSVRHKFMKTAITMDVIYDVLRDMLTPQTKVNTIDFIQSKVANYYNISLAELRSDSKLKELVMPRHVAMYLCKQLTAESFPAIAKKFGGKTHATVIHAVKKIEELMESSSTVALEVKQLLKELQ